MNTVNENVVEKEDEGLTVELPEDNVEEVVETKQQENGEQTRTNVQDSEEDLQEYSEKVQKE